MSPEMRRSELRISFVDVVGRMPEGRLRALLAQPAETIDSILTGSDDRSVSQRIALIAFATRVVSAAIAYFSQVIMARWMADFQYGIFVVVWVGSVIMGGLACLGVQVAVLRFVPEYLGRRELDLLRGVIVGSRIQGLATSTLFALVGLAGLYTFGDHISGYYLVPLYLGAVTLPMIALGEIQEGLARSFNWANLALWPTYIVRPLLIIVFMGGALWFGAPTNAATAMAAVVAATYVTAIGQFFRLQSEIGKAVPRGPKELPAAACGSPSALPIFVVEGFFNLLTNVDILIVGRLMQPEKVAIYFAAVKTMALVHFVYFSVRAGSAQRFSQYYAAGDDARLSAFVRDTLHWTFWPSLAMVAVLMVAGRWLLALFGPNFVEGYPVLFILSVGLLLRASIGPAETLLIMAGQQGITAVVYAVTFFLNVSLNFFLIPYFGINGAAIATAIALSRRDAGAVGGGLRPPVDQLLDPDGAQGAAGRPRGALTMAATGLARSRRGGARPTAMRASASWRPTISDRLPRSGRRWLRGPPAATCSSIRNSRFPRSPISATARLRWRWSARLPALPPVWRRSRARASGGSRRPFACGPTNMRPSASRWSMPATSTGHWPAWSTGWRRTIPGSA